MLPIRLRPGMSVDYTTARRVLTGSKNTCALAQGSREVLWHRHETLTILDLYDNRPGRVSVWPKSYGI